MKVSIWGRRRRPQIETSRRVNPRSNIKNIRIWFYIDWWKLNRIKIICIGCIGNFFPILLVSSFWLSNNRTPFVFTPCFMSPLWVGGSKNVWFSYTPCTDLPARERCLTSFLSHAILDIESGKPPYGFKTLLVHRSITIGAPRGRRWRVEGASIFSIFLHLY